MHICFAAAPLHLICFKELVFSYNVSNYIIYLLVSRNPQVNVQLDQTIKFLKLKNVKKLYWHDSRIIQIFQRYKFLVNLFKEYKSKKCVFIMSDFKSILMHQVRILFKTSKFIYTDDGSQLYEDYNEYFKKKIYFPWRDYQSFLGKIKLLFNFGYQLSHLKNSKFNFFTLYAKELNFSKNSYNEFKFLRKNFKVKSMYSKSSVHLIGTKMSEQKLLTLNEEIKLITKIKNYWNKKKKKLIYIAKRTTSKKKINLIKKKLRIKIMICNLPVELEFLEKKKIEVPSIICSLGSALDKTYPMIYKQSKNYLVIDKELKKYKFFHNYSKLYKELMLKSKLKKNIIEL